jgi:hypothetical protein
MSGVEDAIGADHIFPSVQAGVDDFLALQSEQEATTDRPSETP